jgi:glycosyltransferase involved in cell wall biosynthesis
VLIAGDGPEEAALRAQIAGLGLEDVVLLLGTRSDVPEVLAALDVAVCCSDFEGTPLSVMEYMAAGRPVVATRVGGLPELIEHGVHGLLFELRDPDDLANKVAELLRDPERRDQMGARGVERHKREFDIDATTRQLEFLYECLYAQSERGRHERWAPSTNGT